MVRTRDAKLITTYTPTSSVPDALYDLAADPQERTNLVARPGEGRDAAGLWEDLSGRLLEWLDRVDSPHRAGVAKRLASPQVPRVG
jgi:arylsulfatase A-like enzyme